MDTVLSFGVTWDQLERFVKDNQVVSDYLANRSWNTYRAYGRVLCMFFRWLQVQKGLSLTPAQFLNELVRHRKSEDVEERKWALRLVLEFSRDNPEWAKRNGRSKYGTFSVLRGFCSFHEADLTLGRNVFGKKGMRKYRPKQMSVEVARRVLGVLNQRSRAVCMVMLQSGMSAGDVLGKFACQLEYIRKCITEGESRVKVDMRGRKGNDFEYFTFISQDAIQELKKWFQERDIMVRALKLKGIDASDSVFIKRLNGQPFDLDDFEDEFTYYVKKAGLKDGPYSIHSHMFRKLFKTESRPPERGVDQDCVEFMMGHLSGIESVGGVYDRTPELAPEVIEKEYARLEAYLNIYSCRVAEAGGLRMSEEFRAFWSDPDVARWLKEKMRADGVTI